MIVTILHRMEGTPAAVGTAFIDVPTGQWYSDAVSWASANGIVDGYGGGMFGPSDPITREQMAAILNRYSQHKGYDTGASGSIAGFSDASLVSSYAVEPMGWAVGNGLISGVGNNTLAPKGNATRAQVATILMRFCENIADKANSTSAPDTTVDKTYTVTFNLNYGSDTQYDVKTVKEGETVDKPSNPSRSGYSFSGWYAEKSGSRQFDFKKGITSDLTLYAHWRSNSSSSSGGSSGSNSGGSTTTPTPTPSDGTGNPFVDPDGYDDYEFDPIVVPEPEYESVEDYFNATANGGISETIKASESENVLREAEAKALLENCGFTEYSITYEYSIDGSYIGETEVSATSNTECPMYETFYTSGDEEDGNQVVWAVYIIDGKVFASPVSFLFETDYAQEFLVTESDEFTSYYDGNFYVTVPKDSAVYAQKVAEINADALDALTFDELCRLTGASRLEDGSGELAVASVLDDSASTSADTRATSNQTAVIVSLGDSFSSGEGIEPFIDQHSSIINPGDAFAQSVNSYNFLAHRSEKGWPKLLEVPGKNVELHFWAVSGAVTENIDKRSQRKVYDRYGVSGDAWLPYQLSTSSFSSSFIDASKVDYVTLTIGGNDVDFVGIITEAASASTYLQALFGKTFSLEKKLDELWANIDTTMTDIKRVYMSIARKMPQATIIVAGYPTLLDQNGKGALFSKLEAAMINEKVVAFNLKIGGFVSMCGKVRGEGERGEARSMRA